MAEMLEPTLHSLIPEQVREFAKLIRGEPYHFDRWQDDRYGLECLYYWFMSKDRTKKNEKRVPLREFRPALQQLRSTGFLTRETFEKVCPVAKSAGPCGFAVIGRTFEALRVAAYSGSHGFRLINGDEAARLLGASPSTHPAR